MRKKQKMRKKKGEKTAQGGGDRKGLMPSMFLPAAN